jgi:hypothetical protein
VEAVRYNSRTYCNVSPLVWSNCSDNTPRLEYAHEFLRDKIRWFDMFEYVPSNDNIESIIFVWKTLANANDFRFINERILKDHWIDVTPVNVLTSTLEISQVSSVRDFVIVEGSAASRTEVQDEICRAHDSRELVEEADCAVHVAESRNVRLGINSSFELIIIHWFPLSQTATRRQRPFRLFWPIWSQKFMLPDRSSWTPGESDFRHQRISTDRLSGLFGRCGDPVLDSYRWGLVEQAVAPAAV